MMNGYKTYLAVALYIICEGLKQYQPEWVGALNTIEQMLVFPLGVVGIAHKLDKATA